MGCGNDNGKDGLTEECKTPRWCAGGPLRFVFPPNDGGTRVSEFREKYGLDW